MLDNKVQEVGKVSEMIQSDQKVAPVATVQVEVKFEPSELFNDLGNIYSLEAERVSGHSSSPNLQVTPEELDKYFTTLLYLRIARVRNIRNNTTQAYGNDIRGYLVPSFVHTLLTSIGLATDKDYGFEFIPAVSVDLSALASPEEMRNISLRLSFLHIEGLTCVDTGISLNANGDLQFMAVLSVGEQVLSYKKDHPVYGFFSAFFRNTIIADVISPTELRIRYGAHSDYKRYVRYVVKG